MSSPRPSDAQHASNGLRFAAQAAMTSPNLIAGNELGIQSLGGEGIGSGGRMGRLLGATVPPIIDMRSPWGQIERLLLHDPTWTDPAFSSATMVIVRAGEGSLVPVTLHSPSSYAPWSRLQLLEVVHQQLHTPMDSTGTRIIDTVGEEVYYGGFSSLDRQCLALCMVTRSEARGQLSGNL
ncbi:hypothetical protein K525DRAFT_279887 [Schizophyllum commune Loenen D]|nr:hypothetical protein K525DRAFT_279887 [Schizophyllum commune Loenen D]